MADNKEFLSIPEAAARLGISRIAVFKKVKKGQLEAIRIGRNWAVPAAALVAYGTVAAPSSAARKIKIVLPPSGPSGAEIERNRRVSEAPAASPPNKDSMDDIGWD